ncbi:putative vacuolar membrane transporter for cationic amino acids [Coemansia sp. RSA 2703]|nr:putative vacuolar membrane transporter for cationic amino acids [Coemansia sp. RSA 2703]
MWSLGDLFNLAGALMENLIFTAILLPLYYILTDCIVLSQFYIYRDNRHCSDGHLEEGHVDEERALLSNQHSSNACNESDCNEASQNGREHRIKSRLASTNAILISLALCLLAVVFAVHYYHANLDWFKHIGMRQAIAQIFGYLSAAVYLGAYIPQLVRNYRTKSTEGLSMLMFILVIVANVTYCLSILTFQRPTREYMQKYASWLLGASGTIWLELGVLYQFFIYRSGQRSTRQSSQNSSH